MNRIIITNLEVQYIFLNWDGFVNRLMQIFKFLKITVIAKKRNIKIDLMKVSNRIFNIILDFSNAD